MGAGARLAAEAHRQALGGGPGASGFDRSASGLVLFGHAVKRGVTRIVVTPRRSVIVNWV